MRLFKPDPAHPFQLARFLSVSSLVLIMATAIVLVVFISNYAREVFLQKNRNFALLLAENLNHQIFQRFTLPTLIGYGKVELKNPEQYKRLAEIIASTIHSFHVLNVIIYNNQGVVSYATNKKLLGKKLLTEEQVKTTVEQRKYIFILEKKLSNLKAMFTLNFPPQSVVLKTIYPLKAERTFGLKREPIMGILEFRQDISKDFETIVYFQWLIIVLFICSFLILYVLLLGIINRAEKLLLERIREKEKLKAKLHKTEKLASMGRMVSAIAHEIRNPLGIIQSTSEFLVKKFEKQNLPQAKLLKAIFEESRRLSRTVNDFLDYARPVQVQAKEISLRELLKKIISFLAAELKEREIQINLIGDDLVCKGDPDLLYRVFYNLILNSIQAIDKQGEINIIFEQKQIILQDTGPGFKPRLLEKYLEPFFTTKEQGTGLGLAIVKNILDSHQARLILKNWSKGAEVIIDFSGQKQGEDREPQDFNY